MNALSPRSSGSSRSSRWLSLAPFVLLSVFAGVGVGCGSASSDGKSGAGSQSSADATSSGDCSGMTPGDDDDGGSMVATPGSDAGTGIIATGGDGGGATSDDGGASTGAPAMYNSPTSGAYASPNGSPSSACTAGDPCDWKTAMASSQSTIVLLDGDYQVAESDVWCVVGKTVAAQNLWGARVDFMGDANQGGSCSGNGGFGFGLQGGTVRGLEITATGRWSAINSEDLNGARSTIDMVWVHDVNTMSQIYSSVYGNCVEQGAINAASTDVTNSVLFHFGQRTGVDGSRGPTLQTCINYHAIYVTDHTLVQNDLIMDSYGGFCVHGYGTQHVDNVIENDTLIGCHQAGILLPVFGVNRIADNVIVNNRTDTAGPQYGECVIAYDGTNYDATTLAAAMPGNICEGNVHDAVYESDPGQFVSSFLSTTAPIPFLARATDDIVASLEAAASPTDKLAAVRTLNVDASQTGGAGYVSP